MAVTANTVWEVRSTGSNNNAGGYDGTIGGAGTDYSQQDGAFATYSDLATTAVNKITSVARPFVAADAGNYVNITAGAGFTTGRYRIDSVAAGVATLDRNCTGTSGSGGTAYLGGGLADLTPLPAILVAGNYIWMKGSINYATPGVTISTVCTQTTRIRIRGYGTTRGDGTKATMKATGAAYSNLLTLSGSYIYLANVILDCNTRIGTRGCQMSGTGNYVENCKVLGANLHGFMMSGSQNRCFNCHAQDCDPTGSGQNADNGGAGFWVSNGSNECIGCTATNNFGGGFVNDSGTGVRFINCIAYANLQQGGLGGRGFSLNNSADAAFINCTAARNGSDGIKFQSGSFPGGNSPIVNCLLSGNGGYGINSAVNYSGELTITRSVVNCAFYNNASGAAHANLPAFTGTVTLTADPFTNGSGNVYSLNETAGGGSSARRAGFPGAFPDGLNTGYPDIGAVQADTPTGGSAATTVRSLWRLLTNEDDATPVPDSTVNTYVNLGCQELNRRVGYHYLDTTIALVAGTREYTLPSDFVGIVFAEHNGIMLDQLDLEEWKKVGENWRRSGSKATSKEFVIYGQTLVLSFTPDATMIAAGATLAVRYISTPQDFGTYGPVQLSTQDYPLAVYAGVAIWSSAHPDSALATHRIERFENLFEAGVKAVAAQYEARRLSRPQ